MALLPVRLFVGWLCDCSRYWDYCRARGAAGGQKLEAANLGPPDRSVRERAPALPGRTRAQILATCGSASDSPATASPGVPPAVGQRRAAAAPRLGLAAPQPGRRRALGLLAASPDGATEAILLAHGFSIRLLVEPVRTGFATARAERVVAAGQGARALA